MNKYKESYHFWVGKFHSEKVFTDFIAENADYYILQDEDNDNEIALSKFIQSQGETWIDHDFMESGFEPPQKTLKEQFGFYSFADKWIDKLEKKCQQLALIDINVLIFVKSEEISQPTSVRGSDFELYYLGIFKFEL